ncbi:MAG: adenosylmethionine decarboxylase [bacterium]|nr:adenosylmethionine decarboxylase [bacterium]
MTPVGTHCILELHGCRSDRLNDAGFVREAIEHASQRSLSTLLNLTSHQFEPQGVTAVGLLAESHLSIHTWPEHGYAAVDIFTCGENARPREACEYLAGCFEADKHSLVVLPRGIGADQSVPSVTAEHSEELDLCPVPE